MLARLVGILTIALAQGALAGEAGGGTLVKAEGHVFVKAPGADETAAAPGATLAAGTRVRTGNDGAAEITFEDGSMLRLTRSSSILLSANRRQKQKSSILLFFGRLWSKVSPSRTGAVSYEVSTPNAVCGVRGTEFDTQVGDDGSLRMQVTEGKVAVTDGSGEQVAEPGQQVEADEQGVRPRSSAQGQPGYGAWQAAKQQRLRTETKAIVESIKVRVLGSKDELESLRSQQKALEEQRKAAEERARQGDEGALAEVRRYDQQLAELADRIADIGDETTAQVGLVDHFADLAGDPRFRGISRKYIELEAASLRRVKASLDAMVAEGTDMSVEGMDRMLDDMGKGKGSLREKKGSTTDDLFDGDEMKMP